jgi:hypothetical protein
MTAMPFPRWVEQILDPLTNAISYSGLGDTEVRYTPAHRSWTGDALIELAPARVLLLTDEHPDGEHGSASVQGIDVLVIQRALDEVRGVALDVRSSDDVPRISIEGRVGGRAVTIEARMEPFDDAEVKEIVDVRTTPARASRVDD